MSAAALKRVFDVALTVIATPIALPLAAGLVVLVRLASPPGPGLFKQTRVGRNRRPFVCYKIRSMRQQTQQAATHLVATSAVTPIGRILRATKLDELPQLYNVLAGEMSLVGPRPSLPNQTRLIAERDGRGVLAARPGITGLAQVLGVDMSNERRLARLDQVYVNTQWVGLDVAILIATVLPSEWVRRALLHGRFQSSKTRSPKA